MIGFLWRLVVGKLEHSDHLMEAVGRFFDTQCTCSDENFDGLCPQVAAEESLRALYDFYREQQ